MASADRRDIPDEGTDLSAVKDAAYSLGETLEEVVTEHPLTALGLALGRGLAARLDVAPPITIRTRIAAPARRRAGLDPLKGNRRNPPDHPAPARRHRSGLAGIVGLFRPRSKARYRPSTCN
jgi:hypothetical protein